MTKTYDFVVVGSGAGGATVARGLARRGKSVLVVERGRREPELGTFVHCLRYFDLSPITKLPRRSREGVMLFRALMAGGSTMVSVKNANRSLEDEFRDRGIDLEEDWKALEHELGVARIPEELVCEASWRVREAAAELGLHFERATKFLYPDKCPACGLCCYGCRFGARWTALQFLDEAVRLGAGVEYSTTVESIVEQGGTAVGVRGRGPHGPVEFRANHVVVAAGGLGTPVILQNSGIEEAGGNLFVDLQTHVYGVTAGMNMLNEPQLRFVEGGLPLACLPSSRLIGLLIKQADEPAGRVFPDGSVSKPVTERDRSVLEHAVATATGILTRAGAEPDSICVSHQLGCHPGGTAAIGTVVDTNMQTEMKNLYVCDASVLPRAPGLPPILTILALARRLARQVA